MNHLSRAVWRKASRSGNQGNCVEVATNLRHERGAIYVRDSKNPAGPVLTFTHHEWAGFVRGVQDGEFDLK